MVFIDHASELEILVDIFSESGVNVELYTPDDHFLNAPNPSRAGCFLIESAVDSAQALVTLQRLVSSQHRVAPILVADGGGIPLVVQAIRLGAVDVLEKPVDHAELVIAVVAALETLKSESALATPFGQKVDKRTAQIAWSSLTERQGDILDRIVDGQSNKAIAVDLEISQRTAENHRAAIMKKMSASSPARLIQIVLALRRG